MLAITDHDTVAGVDDARHYLAESAVAERFANFQLISGVEISSRWGSCPVHVLGLAVNTSHPALLAFLGRQQALRCERNHRLLARLDELGYYGVRDCFRGGAMQAVNRPAIAACLAELAYVPDSRRAFKRILGKGKAASIAVDWPGLDETVAIIRRSGGYAVLAHPLHYKLGGRRLQALAAEFSQCGGHALEACTGIQPRADVNRLTKLARQHQLLVSQGSDFHGASSPWRHLGAVQGLPAHCDTLWEHWQAESLLR